jgi:hypothetical protein
MLVCVQGAWKIVALVHGGCPELRCAAASTMFSVGDARAGMLAGSCLNTLHRLSCPALQQAQEEGGHERG